MNKITESNEKRFVNFKIFEKDGSKKKLPWNCELNAPAKINDPTTWYTYETAKWYVRKGKADNIAIALTGKDRLVCIDLDHAVENGVVLKNQLKIINKMNSYTECSVSGKGIHIFCYGHKPGQKSRTAKSSVDIEIYDKARFIILTENVIKHPVIEERDKELNEIYYQYLDPQLKEQKQESVIEIIKKSKYGEKFTALFEKGDLSLFNGDHSSCDASLMHIICKFVKDNQKAIELFKKSALNREKFENRLDYQQRLIDLARSKEIKEKEKKDYHLITDYDICLMMKSSYNNKILYNLNNGFYYYYNGKYYKKDASEILVKSLNNLILNIENLGEYTQKEINRIKTRYLSAKGAKDIKEYYKYLPGVIVSSDKFNAEPNLICCKNGIVDLKTNELLEHDQKYLITKYVDIEWELISNQKFLDSKFYKYLRDVTEDNLNLIEYLQKLAGYFLTGETNDQSFYYLIGKASTGKSVFLELIRNITGTYCKGVQQNAFNINSSDFMLSLATISEARVVISSEENACNKMNTSLMKQLTGQDTITARYLFCQPFDYLPKFKIVISTNEAPKMISDVASMKRRLKPIPFNRVFKGEERNPNLIIELLEEIKIIFIWACSGAGKYYKLGLEPPIECKRVIKEIFDDQDVFILWAEQWCRKDKNAFATTQELWQSYENFCSNNGTGTGFKNMLCFSRYLSQRDYVEKASTGRLRGYKGLAIIRRI